MAQVWGLCRECQWWETQPGAPHENMTMGECNQHELQVYVLRVSGGSGCNRFTAAQTKKTSTPAAAGLSKSEKIG